MTNDIIIERAKALGISLQRALEMTNPDNFDLNKVPVTPKKNCLDNLDHHMVRLRGKYYLKVVINAKCHSKPLSVDPIEARRMRDEFLNDNGFYN
jgi:hypothetical protein